MKIQLSGCAIINDQGELLVLWKIKHQHFEFPGGKVEEGESLEDTAIREVKEELGVDVQLGKYIGYEEFHIDGKDFQSHKYIGKIKDGQKPYVAEPERFEKIFWMPIKEYEKYSTAPNVKEFCRKWNEREIAKT